MRYFIGRIKVFACAALCISVLLAAVSSDVFYVSGASGSVQSKIDAAVQKKQQAKKDSEAAKQKKSAAQKDKERLDDDIDTLEAELNEIDSIISETETGIAQKEAEIADFEQKISDNDAAFRARLRAMDENNTATYLDVLLNAASLSDFFGKMETIQEISENDQAIIDNMKTLKDGVAQSKAALEEKKSEQVEARGLVEGKRQSLNAKIQEKSSLIKTLEANIAEYDKIYKEQERQENALKESLKASLSKPSSAVSPKYVSGVFTWPATSYSVTSAYGYRIHPVYKTKKYHSGIDIGAAYGTAVSAANGGTVTLAGWNGGYGNCIVVDHGGGLATLYGHLSSISVSRGATVSKGQQIGKVGSTGVSTGPHLHFEVLKGGSATDPMAYFK